MDHTLALILVFLALFYTQIKKNTEAMLIDVISLVMGVVGGIIMIINKIRQWLWQRTIN